MGTHVPPDNLSAALFGHTRCAVLALLFGHVDESYYMREVVRHTETGIGAVQRELKRLSRVGIIQREVRGRHVYYRANRACPIFVELQGMMVKTAGVAHVLRIALAGLVDRIETAFLYGSMVKGSAGAKSDADLLVVGKVAFAEVVAALGPAQEKLGREINPSVYPPDELRQKLAQGHHFLTTVWSEPKVFLIGDEHELTRLAKERLADATSNQPARNRRSARRRRP